MFGGIMRNNNGNVETIKQINDLLKQISYENQKTIINESLVEHNAIIQRVTNMSIHSYQEDISNLSSTSEPC